MVDLNVRDLDDHVARVLRARAEQKGISLEEEVRRTLSASVRADRQALVRRAEGLRKQTGDQPGRPELDSARIVRKARDAWG